MSISAFAIAQTSIAQPLVLSEKKTPPKRTVTAVAAPILTPEAR